MAFSDFTYSILSGAVEIPLTPVVETLVFTGEEDEDLGAYVKRLETQFIFIGSDYSTLYDNWEGAGLCDALPFTIDYNGAEYYTGILRVGGPGGIWDVSNCRYRASIEPSGSWKCLQDEWEEEFNIFDGASEVTVNTFLGTLTEYTCGPVNAGAPVTVNGYFEANVSGCLTGPLSAYSLKRARIEEITPGSSYDHYATWVTEEITVACSGGSPIPPPGDGWILITDNCPTDATYARAPQMIYDGDYRATSKLYWDNRYSVAGGDVTEIDNAVPLNDLLEWAYPCAGNIISDFFGINADATYPSGSSAYTEALANLQNVVLWQKTDVKLANATNNATIGTWTLKKLLESLKTQLNVQWRSDASGNLRLEHVSYWEDSNGTDLSASSRITGLHSYQYDGDGLARYEDWQWMESASSLFEADRIKYGDCVGVDAAEEIVHRADLVNNDVGYIQANPDQVSDEGFVFANTYVDSGQYYFVTEASEFGGDLLFNGHMSWPNLMSHYHRWERPLPSGRLNNVQTTFESSKRRRKQVDVSYTLSNADFLTFDPYQLVKTQMGWGKVERYRYDAKSCLMTLTLSHE